MVAFGFSALGPAAAAAEPPWQSADGIRADLFEAQTQLLFGERSGRAVAAAETGLSGPLRRGLEAEAERELREIEASLRAAKMAAADLDEVALAAARGQIVSALRRGAMAVAIAAAGHGDAAAARSWLQIRDFRQTTRFTRPGVNATAALQQLASREISRHEAVVQIEKDLLDTFQARLMTNLDEATQAAERGFGGRFAETGATVRGYWLAIGAEYGEQRGAAERRRTGRDVEQLATAAENGDRGAYEAARKRVEADLEGFTAAPLTPDEQVNRASQLTRFLDLVPKEYDKGTTDSRVTAAFEVQEGVAFMDGVEAAFSDLEPVLLERDREAVERIKTAFALLREDVDNAQQGVSVAPQEELDAARDRASDAFEQIAPEEWTEPSDEADYELVDISLDQLEAAAGAGQYQQAEQARLAAYGFFEFGPELKLRAFDTQMALEIEGLIWYGASGDAGLAELVARNAPLSEIRETRLDLDEKLADARALTGDGASALTTITNSALIVFREGLEAILILAAITASMIGPRAPLRRPIYRGALLAIPASMLMFVLGLLLLDSLAQYGEKLEAVVGIVAIAVLLLVMNWFFHRVYWTEWIKGHRERGKVLTGAALAAGAGAATVAGLYTLGFTSVFREGFETVLFLQALQLSSGTGVVLAGVSLGLVLTGIVGALTFTLERKLPYKKMLVATGVLIALVLVVLVGNTARTMQGVGWLPIHPIDVELPLWMGTWLGVYPTVETLTAQLLAFCFVIGSYFAAEWMRKRELRRAIAAHEASLATDGEQVAEPEAANGNGADADADYGAIGSADDAVPTPPHSLSRR
ncbi:MAG TPA: FTR1 family protein [Solirubrobacterales bacterium]|jgi:high-affinity iron transporter|nr:FTR1 family protein [Solirubrobacterales bacterium]